MSPGKMHGAKQRDRVRNRDCPSHLSYFSDIDLVLVNPAGGLAVHVP